MKIKNYPIIRLSFRDWIPSLKVCIPIIFFGISIIIGGLYSQQDRLAFLSKGVRLPGIVVAMRMSRNTDGINYYPTVEFKDLKGMPLQYTSDMTSSPPSYHVGQKVFVLHNPITGKTAIDSFGDLYGPSLLIAAFGGFFVIFGLVPYIIALLIYLLPNLPEKILNKLGRSKLDQQTNMNEKSNNVQDNK